MKLTTIGYTIRGINSRNIYLKLGAEISITDKKRQGFILGDSKKGLAVFMSDTKRVEYFCGDFRFDFKPDREQERLHEAFKDIARLENEVFRLKLNSIELNNTLEKTKKDGQILDRLIIGAGMLVMIIGVLSLLFKL